jgi:hypothetical protein
MQTANHTAINTLPRLAQVALPVSVPTIGLDLLAFVGKTRSAIDGAVPYRVRYHCCGREETITAATVAGRGRTHRASLCQVCARTAKAVGCPTACPTEARRRWISSIGTGSRPLDGPEPAAIRG